MFVGLKNPKANVPPAETRVWPSERGLFGDSVSLEKEGWMRLIKRNERKMAVLKVMELLFMVRRLILCEVLEENGHAFAKHGRASPHVTTVLIIGNLQTNPTDNSSKHDPEHDRASDNTSLLHLVLRSCFSLDF
ncbi:hypothetical protein J5N97_011203 [Dioscorea zingiberensis]|uniref:Uncharacterized protein n=1 Tax=Dioscorea zingiberensis TaxID=325984 RepID=A0A9D5D0U0_9LILI|nr:hypothetical protein J5N97_011203 [Dioscorea zingiberensis]